MTDKSALILAHLRRESERDNALVPVTSMRALSCILIFSLFSVEGLLVAFNRGQPIYVVPAASVANRPIEGLGLGCLAAAKRLVIRLGKLWLRINGTEERG